MIIRTGDLPSALNTQNKQQSNNIDDTKKENSAASIASAANSIGDASEVDNSKKVEEIKKQIDDGTYEVDVNKTADKMAQDLLLES